MNKKITVSIVFGLLLLIGLMLWRLGQDDRRRQGRSPVVIADPVIEALPAENSPMSGTNYKNGSADVEVELLPRTSKSEPTEVANAPRPEYVWYTQPTSKGAIKNSKGDVIFQATDDLPFVSIRSKANVSQVVIISANRKAFLIDTETKQRITLPKQPPEEGAKGFENWELIDNHTLLAEYQVPANGQDGNSVNCCQGHSIAQTNLYAYDIQSNVLSRVVLPKQLEGIAFSIGHIASDSSIEVVISTNHLTEERRVGWFNLNVK